MSHLALAWQAKLSPPSILHGHLESASQIFHAPVSVVPVNWQPAVGGP